MSQQNDNILAAISYFDVFDYPLTAWELYHWQYDRTAQGKQLNFKQVLAELKQLVQSKQIYTQDGFYFLPRRQNLVQVRQRRYMLSILKYKLALKAIRILRWLPFIKYIGVCNTLAYFNAKQNSDIDLFIITQHKKVWSARFFAAGLMQLLDWRPTAKQVKDKICLSFFIDENDLNIQAVSLHNDIYLRYWINQVVPIYDEYNLHTRFLAANNWVNNHLTQSVAFMPIDKLRVPTNFIQRGIKRFLELMFGGGFFEKWFKQIQLRILPQNLKQIMNQDTRVVLNDRMLKFHDQDGRKKYAQEFEQNMKQLTAS